MTLHGISPPMIRAPATGLTRRRARVDLGRDAIAQRPPASTAMYWPPGLGEVAGEQPDELLQVADQRRVRGSSARRGPRTRRRSTPPRCAAPPRARASSSTPRDRAVLGDVDRAKRGVDLVERRRRARRARRRSMQALLHEDRDQRREQPGVAAGPTWRWKSASSAVSVRRGSITIIARLGVLGDLLQRRAGVRDAVATATGSCR